MGGLGPGLDPPSCPGLQAPSHSSFTLQPQRQVVAGWWLGDMQKDGGLLAKDSTQPLPLLVTLAVLVQTLPEDPFSHPVSGLLGFWTVGLSSSDLMGFGFRQRGPTALCHVSGCHEVMCAQWRVSPLSTMGWVVVSPRAPLLGVLAF